MTFGFLPSSLSEKIADTSSYVGYPVQEFGNMFIPWRNICEIGIRLDNIKKSWNDVASGRISAIWEEIKPLSSELVVSGSKLGFDYYVLYENGGLKKAVEATGFVASNAFNWVISPTWYLGRHVVIGNLSSFLQGTLSRVNAAFGNYLEKPIVLSGGLLCLWALQDLYYYNSPENDRPAAFDDRWDFVKKHARKIGIITLKLGLGASFITTNFHPIVASASTTPPPK